LLSSAVPAPQGLRPLRVLVVDDRAERRRLVHLALRGNRSGAVEVIETDSAATTLEALDAHGADAVVLEIQMRDGSGLVAALRSRHPKLVIVVCSFQTNLVTRALARDAGADHFLAKPVRGDDLYSAASSSPRPAVIPVGVLGARDDLTRA
jgi:DNA-binding response OmpR family regulator